MTTANAKPSINEPITVAGFDDDIPLPKPLEAMWRALKRGYDAEPKLIVIAFSLSLLAALPDALLALWLKFLVDGILEDNTTLLYWAAIGIGISAASTWFLRVISDRTQRRFRDRVTIALESHVAKLQAEVATLSHHERPIFLDRLAILRDQVFVLDHMYMSLFTTAGWALRLSVILILLMSIHPALLLLIVFALPTVWVSTKRPAIERAIEEKMARHYRLARHFFNCTTEASQSKEVRILGLGESLLAKRQAAWYQGYQKIAEARNQTALWQSGGWLIFALGYISAVVFVAVGLNASAGAVLLVLAAGSRLSGYISATVGELGFLRGIWMDGSIRMAWLEDYAASQQNQQPEQTITPPAEIKQALRYENVGFRYPGTDRWVLKNINFSIPPGKVVAIVGENGAGKSTLVKLLCGLYPPTEGRILVDHEDIRAFDPKAWRAKLTGAFQDFFQFEYQAAMSVGIGDLMHLQDQNAIDRALAQAGASDVVANLPQQQQTQLGADWPNGVGLSFGQWQKIALARGFMRPSPLIMILDEPTAALDAETEHALFEQYAKMTRTTDNAGKISFLISHRFSTVRMADLIIVMLGHEIAEIGSHEQLMANKGHYASLYQIQAQSYR